MDLAFSAYLIVPCVTPCRMNSFRRDLYVLNFTDQGFDKLSLTNHHRVTLSLLKG